MRNIWVIGRHEYLTGLLRPSFIIITLLIPLLGLISLGVAAFAGGQASSFVQNQFGSGLNTIAVVDSTGRFTPIPPDLEAASRSDENKGDILFRAYPDESAAKAALLDGNVDAVLEFPADFMQSGHVTIIATKQNIEVSYLEGSGEIRQLILTSLLKESPDNALRSRLMDPITSANKLDPSGKPMSQQGSDFGLEYFVPYIVAIFLAISIFSSGSFLLQGVSQEKTTRVVEIILSSVTSWELLAGKVIGLGFLGLTRVGVWLGSAFLLGQGAIRLLATSLPIASKPEILILYGVYYILGFLVFSILMGTCGALGATQQEAQQLSGIFTMIALVPLWIGGFLFSNPNAPVARILSWFPLSAPTMMMLRLSLGTVSPIDIIGSIAVLIISIPLITWLGSKLFRYGLLMYGKRPTFKQMIRIMRQA